MVFMTVPYQQPPSDAYSSEQPANQQFMWNSQQLTPMPPTQQAYFPAQTESSAALERQRERRSNTWRLVIILTLAIPLTAIPWAGVSSFAGGGFAVLVGMIMSAITWAAIAKIAAIFSGQSSTSTSPLTGLTLPKPFTSTHDPYPDSEV